MKIPRVSKIKGVFPEESALLHSAISDVFFMSRTARNRAEKQTRRAIATAYQIGEQRGVDRGVQHAARLAYDGILGLYEHPKRRAK